MSFICEICKQSFASQAYLNKHLNNKIPCDLKCPECGMKCKNRKQYERHNHLDQVSRWPLFMELVSLDWNDTISELYPRVLLHVEQYVASQKIFSICIDDSIVHDVFGLLAQEMWANMKHPERNTCYVTNLKDLTFKVYWETNHLRLTPWMEQTER